MQKRNDAIGRFMARVQSANRSGSRDVVLSLQEAVDLTTSITQLLDKQSSLLEDIVDLQKRSNSGPINLSGGNFDE